MERCSKNIKNIIFITIFTVSILTTSIISSNIYENKIAVLEQDLLSSEELNEDLERQLEQTANKVVELQNEKTDLESINENITDENTLLINENNELSTTIEDLKSTKYKLVYIGKFEITYYCTETYEHICNEGGSSLTSSGTTVTAGRTIAVDTGIIPYGTKVYIAGVGWRTAEDTGGAVNGNHIDVAVGTHEEAMANGIKYKDVWILVRS